MFLFKLCSSFSSGWKNPSVCCLSNFLYEVLYKLISHSERFSDVDTNPISFLELERGQFLFFSIYFPPGIDNTLQGMYNIQACKYLVP